MNATRDTSVRIDPILHQSVKSFVEPRGMKIGFFINEAIREKLQRDGIKKKTK